MSSPSARATGTANPAARACVPGVLSLSLSRSHVALSQIEKNGKQMFVPARRDVQTVCGTAGQRYDDDEARARLSRGQS